MGIYLIVIQNLVAGPDDYGDVELENFPLSIKQLLAC